jgi:hypothetical protein
MYASQWFLTLFAAKFPLFLVFRVLDVFLLYGADVIFQVIHSGRQCFGSGGSMCFCTTWIRILLSSSKYGYS